jgi:hypothetical protein
MRKLLIVAAVALTAVIVAPATAGYAAPSHAQATGTGTLDASFGSPTAHVNAIQTKPGLKGSFTITYPDGTTASGTPTCLTVIGTTAYVTGVITDSGGPRQQPNHWAVGNFLTIGVQDNGEPGTSDRLNFSPGSAASPGCRAQSGRQPRLHHRGRQLPGVRRAVTMADSTALSIHRRASAWAGPRPVDDRPGTPRRSGARRGRRGDRPGHVFRGESGSRGRGHGAAG